MARYSIVGQRHIGLDPYLEGILPGTPVLLVREPTNAYDANAIQVWIDGKRVGFLTAKDAANLAPIIDERGALAPIDSVRVDTAIGEVTQTQYQVSANAIFARSPNSSYPQVEFEPEPKA